MHIRSIRLKHFKRFFDLTIEGMPSTTKLVVLAGPNGFGKSSLFEAFNIKDKFISARGIQPDKYYYSKDMEVSRAWDEIVNVEFFEDLPGDPDTNRKVFHLRSAYRNETDFQISALQRQGRFIDLERLDKLINNDQRVRQNYEIIASKAVGEVFSQESKDTPAGQIADRLIGQIRDAMQYVFDDLLLEGPGEPLRDGSFFFSKGTSKNYHFKNLSGGEKAAFDILLDFIVKREEFNDTVFCLDEPELHLNTRVQSRLIKQLFDLVPEKSQLWIATHSIGMMKMAKDLQEQHGEQVVFLDFEREFDTAIVMEPERVTRSFWQRTLRVALAELSDLIAPSRIIICEGSLDTAGKRTRNTQFDAVCYRNIFGGEFADTEFVSVGSSSEVQIKGVELESILSAIVSGVQVWRIIDKDDLTETEIGYCREKKIYPLSRRNLEAYLLDEEVWSRLCKDTNQEGKEQEVLAVLCAVISNANGNAKDACGPLHSRIKSILQFPSYGSNAHAFLRDIVSPHVVPGMAVYDELKKSVFNL